MKTLCIILLVLCAGALAYDKCIYIPSSDRPLEADWRLTQGDIAMERVPWPNGESGLTVKFSYKANPEGWPSGKFYLPEELRDWRSVSAISVELFVTRPGRVGFNIASEGAEKPLSYVGLNFEAGRRTLKVQLDEGTGLDLSKIKFIDIFTSKPTEPYDLYVGEIHLEVRDEEEEAERIKNKTAEIGAALSWRQKMLGSSKEKYREFMAMTKALLQAPSQDKLERVQEIAKKNFIGMDLDIFRNSSGKRGYSAFWCAPEEKVLRDTYAFLAPLNSSREVLDAALGEGESAQLVVFSANSRKDFQAILADAPVNKYGDEIPLSRVRLSPVGYVKTTAPAYPVEYKGYWPDPILEYLNGPIELEGGKYQSFWLDVDIPADQKPGKYRSEVLLLSEGKTLSMPFEIDVHPFELKGQVPYFSPVQHLNFPCDSNTPEAIAYRTKVGDMLIRHRLQADEIYYGCERSDLVEYAKHKLSMGAPAFNLGYFNGPVSDEQFRQIQDAWRKCKEAGILNKAYIYAFDEAPAERFGEIKTALTRIREAAPGVPIYTTLYDHTFGIASGLDELVDGWIPLTRVYGREAEGIEKARARGKKVLWYVCCTPLMPYANFILEHPGTGVRLLMGFMFRKFRPDGFLYYNACVWREWEKQSNGDYKLKNFIQTPISGGPLLEYPWIGESFQTVSGDGRLLYPAADAPVPTQRLKLIRDGMDDYMYLELLEKCLTEGEEMPPAWQSAATKELEIENSLVESLSKWTTNPQLLQAKRSRIIKLLDEYFTR